MAKIKIEMISVQWPPTAGITAITIVAFGYTQAKTQFGSHITIQSKITLSQIPCITYTNDLRLFASNFVIGNMKFHYNSPPQAIFPLWTKLFILNLKPVIGNGWKYIL